MAIRIGGKTAKAATTKPAPKPAATSLLQNGKGGSGPTNPTKRVAVKGKGLYLPHLRSEEFVIPGRDELNVPSDSPFDYVWGVYGMKGWGKSSFANLFGLEEEEVYTTGVNDRPCWTMMTESLRKGLEIRMSSIPQASVADMKSGDYFKRYKLTPWEHCKGYLISALQNDSVRMIAIDSFNEFCQHALNHWCLKEDVNNPTDKRDHGRLWSTIKTDVLGTLEEVKESGRGIVLTGHDKKVVVEDPFRGDYYTMQPDISDWPFSIWKQITDFVMYGVFSSTGRSIFVRGNQYLHASCGNKKRFLYADDEGTEYPIASFNAGNSEEEAYVNFLQAFRNELPPELWFNDLAALAEEAAKKKVKKPE